MGNVTDLAWRAWASFVHGRVSRSTFVFRTSIYLAVICLLYWPANTFLATSPQLLVDIYLVVGLTIFAACVLAYASAYTKRLHDIGLPAWLTPVLLIGIPIALGYFGYAYDDYRRSPAHIKPPTGINDIIPYAFLIVPFAIALWRGQVGANRYGDEPTAIEHFSATPWNAIISLSAAALVIPSAIYAGLFQSEIWVGKTNITGSMPMVSTSTQGHTFLRCWDIRGVGAAAGDGALTGIYRDGYKGQVLDFVVYDDDTFDVVPGGEAYGEAYRSDGFNVTAVGLSPTDGYVSIRDVERFAIIATHVNPQIPDSALNITTFSFAKGDDGWPQYEMVMSTGLSAAKSPLLNRSSARGRLMMGECIEQ